MIKVSQYFTGHGIVGVIFFFLGNIGGAWKLMALMRAPAYGAPGVGDTIVLFVFGMMAMAALPLMLIGRGYDMQVTDIPRELRRPTADQ